MTTETLDAKVSRLMALADDIVDSACFDGFEAALRKELSAAAVLGEPVGKLQYDYEGGHIHYKIDLANEDTPDGALLYTTPQPAIAQLLDSQTVDSIWESASDADSAEMCIYKFAELIQAAVQPAQPIGGEVHTDMTAEEANAYAWSETKKAVGTAGWTVIDHCTYQGFFNHGWSDRGQFEKQRAQPAPPLQDAKEAEITEELIKLVNLRWTLNQVKRTLALANELSDGPINDTIWYSGTETLFDFIDAAIASQKGAV